MIQVKVLSLNRWIRSSHAVETSDDRRRVQLRLAKNMVTTVNAGNQYNLVDWWMPIATSGG